MGSLCSVVVIVPDAVDTAISAGNEFAYKNI